MSADEPILTPAEALNAVILSAKERKPFTVHGVAYVPDTDDGLLRRLRTAVNALEAGGDTVTGEFDLWQVAGIHPEPGENVELVLPVRLTIVGHR